MCSNVQNLSIINGFNQNNAHGGHTIIRLA